jgi:signal transduction histidine kinase
VLLALLAVVPALALAAYMNVEERHRSAARVQGDSLRLARLVSADQERLIEGARQLLMTLARLPVVRGGDAGACHALFTDLVRQYPSYVNFVVIAPDGDVWCSGIPMNAPVDAADRAYFRRAIQTRDFAVGEYQIGRISHRAVLVFGYPVLDDAGGIRAVVSAALDLAWLSEFASRAQLPPGSMLTVIDRNGTILARYPDPGQWIGKRMPESDIVKAVLAGQGAGTAEGPGADGVPRLFAFAPLGGTPQGVDAFVSIGIPATVAYAEADRTLMRNLLGLWGVAVLAFGAAWLGGHLLIVRRVQALVKTTNRLSAGDLGARTGLASGRGELCQLARAVDQMAESLELAQQGRLLEEELRRKNYELEQQNRSIQETARLKTEFVSIVSHELRTPLTSILGYVELLLEGRTGTLGGELRECLTIVRGSVDRLLGLIDDLLDVSRIEAGKIELHRARLDLNGLIRGVAEAVRPLIDGKAQQLALDLAELPPVWADDARVVQILTNLVANANKYTPRGGRIAVAARRDDGFVRVNVSDSGIGLTSEEQAQLFTRYFRADPTTRMAGGTGLGLTIARLLVELHGGTLTVRSAPGQGSTFSFSLPVTQVTDAALAEAG